MKVAIITENFLPKLDGVTHTLSQLLQYLQSHGHQAILMGPESGMAHYAGAELVGTAGVPLPFYPELKFNFFRPLFFRRLNEFQPDVVHLVDPVWLGAAGLAAVRWLNRPLISSYHTNLAAYCQHFGFSFLTEPMWSYNRFIHNQCALTFCPSQSTAQMLQDRGFQRVRIWSRGVDLARFSPERRSSSLRARWLKQRTSNDKKILLYTGRISWEKNLRLLVEAYKKMDHRRCHLVMVGDGPAISEIQQELEGLPVTFTGYLRGEDLARAYASADIFAFPSRTETFGQVVLEAMASGLPVAGVDSEGVCDLVQDGQTGLLLHAEHLDEVKQITAYRRLLERLCTQTLTRRQMAQAAIESAQGRTWSEAMQSLMDGYEEAIEQSLLISAA